MNHRKLVLPEYMNAQGSLFGGYLLKWLDEFAYITASMEFPDNHFVTIALNNVEFKHPIHCGQILRFAISRCHLGQSSVEYLVQVFDESSGDMADKVLFETGITFVNVTATGEKQPILQPGAA